MLLILGLFSLALGAPASWRVAPIELEGPSARTGDFVSVDELLTAELFGVLQLDPGDPRSLQLYERWLEDPASRARTPLVVVRRIDVGRLHQWLPEGEGGRVWMLEADPLAGLPRAPGPIMMCTPYGCAPGAASGTLLRLGGPGLLRDTGATSLEQARAMLDADAKLAKRLVRKLPKAGRATVAAMAHLQQLEALAIVLVLADPDLETLADFVYPSAFDVECRMRTPSTCLAYGQQLRGKGASRARGVIEHACGQGLQEACEELAAWPVQRSPPAPEGAPAASEGPAHLPQDLPAAFDPAWWPADPAWNVPFRKSRELRPAQRVQSPRYPDLEHPPSGDVSCYTMLILGADGAPRDVRAAGCPTAFAEAAVAAVRTWQWKKSEEPVSTVIKVTFRR